MKRILGLDLGTNSIGWALIEQDFANKSGSITAMGTRVIPMSQDILSEFGKGNSVSQTAERTAFRSTRRLRERYLLRRERMHRVLHILGFLPAHYDAAIDFEKRLGQFKDHAEPKLAYQPVWDDERGKSDYQFVFRDAFHEMLEDFRAHQPSLLSGVKGEAKLIPYDWTIYYLRQKALREKIGKEELAWILLNFNQKRGYYQLRGEEEEQTPNKLVEYYSLKVIAVSADEMVKGKSEQWYSLQLENGWVYRRSSKTPLSDWKDKTRDFIVTTDLNEDGSVRLDKGGVPKRSFRAPGEGDWTLLKKKTEQDIDKSDKTVGQYVYDSLLQNPKQKINGRLVRTIERKYYKEELTMILRCQQQFHPELNDNELYNECVRELYRSNSSHQLLLSKKNIIHLLVEDILYYQRPLSSQKFSIGNCSLEYRSFNNKDGVKQKQHLKVIASSNPYYQEFRLWQWISNLSIYRKEDDINVTSEFLAEMEHREKLFEFLNSRRDIEQKILLKYFLEQKGMKGKLLSAALEKYRWNYVEDKKYPCNETRALIFSRLERFMHNAADFSTRETEQHLWHIIYSVSDKIDYEKALHSFAVKHGLDVLAFVESFKKIPPFESSYGAFSEKAIKKLLPLMRLGGYWNWEAIDVGSKNRIERILTGEYDESIKDRVREKAKLLQKEIDFQGLPLWLAQYIVYDRHSEAAIADKWSTVADLEKYIGEFRQHSLRNPIVEQVITETLRVVRDIWRKYGGGASDFIHEIHIELGREMKNTKEDRARMTKQISENENTNMRIKCLLAELMQDSSVENVRPYSPMQQEALKIYEEGVLNSGIEITEDILKISKTAQPSSADLKRYKLWLEQKYCSPYTGTIIPLNKLFTPEYEIEHIIPQSRYFDDSFSNKVICEAAVNKLKDNDTGLAFVKKCHGHVVECGFGKKVKIFDVSAYEDFVKRVYAQNLVKRNKLLMEDIPEKMIERQMNDTRYISKFVANLLSNIVRADVNDDGFNSKNLLAGNGRITSELKQDWGLNDVWNDLILPRFERMNRIGKSTVFTAWSKQYQKLLPSVPVEFSRGFSKKRIDHRHHALDALVIACVTRDHINLLNNLYAGSQTRHDLNRKLRHFEKVQYPDPQTGKTVERDVPKAFLKPWEHFTSEAYAVLSNIVVSFKQNLRVINATTNYYQKWVEKDGLQVKELHEQQGVNWAIRKPMHKDTVSGLVQLRQRKMVSLNVAFDLVDDIVHKELRAAIKAQFAEGRSKKDISKYFKDRNNEWEGQDIARVEVYFWEKDLAATRVTLDDSFDAGRIETITDSGIQKILLRHLDQYKDRVDEKGKDISPSLLAFSPEGIEEMNKNMLLLNKGKDHQPVFKVRTYEPKGNKFAVGQTGNKSKKYVEAAKGTNLFFAIYQDSKGKRSYETIPLNVVIERQKQRLPSVPELDEKGDRLLFQLSPNDLVYIPTEEERGQRLEFTLMDKGRVDNIYKVVSFTGNQIFFIRHDIAFPIVNKAEYSPLNKMERSIDGTMIKEVCVKIALDRLGNIKQ